MKVFFVTAALVTLACWWTMLVVWQRGTMHFVAGFVPTSSSVVRDRVFDYATRGVISTTDIVLNQEELSHIADVAQRKKIVTYILNIGGALSWSFLLILIARKQFPRSALRYAAYTLLSLCVAICLFLVLFPITFVWFHEVFFPGGNWAFPPTSALIQAFPQDFWMGMSLLLFFVLGIFATLYWMLSRHEDYS